MARQSDTPVWDKVADEHTLLQMEWQELRNETQNRLRAHDRRINTAKGKWRRVK